MSKTTIASIGRVVTSRDAFTVKVAGANLKASDAAWLVAFGAAAWQSSDPQHATAKTIAEVIAEHGTNLPLGKNALPLAIAAAKAYAAIMPETSPLPTEDVSTFTGRKVRDHVGGVALLALSEDFAGTGDWAGFLTAVVESADAAIAAKMAGQSTEDESTEDESTEDAADGGNAATEPVKVVGQESPAIGAVTVIGWNAKAKALTWSEGTMAAMPEAALRDAIAHLTAALDAKADSAAA